MHGCSILNSFPLFILIQLINCKNIIHRESIYDAKGVIDFVVDTQQVSSPKVNVGNKWPMGNVLYFLDSKSYDQIFAKRVRMLMNQLEGTSCIQFVPLMVRPEPEVTYLEISNPDKIRECVHKSVTEKDSGAIRLVFGYDCLQKRNILHTLMHGLGFRDEVTHPLRDQFIRVLWSNINPKYRQLFKVTAGPTLGEYDPRSIMHFHDRAFSHNGQATVVPLLTGLLINPSDKLSPLDTMKLRVQFGQECNKRKVDNLLGTCKNVLRAQQGGGGNSKEKTNTELVTDAGSEETKSNEEVINEDGNKDDQNALENDSSSDLSDGGSGNKRGKNKQFSEYVDTDANEKQDPKESNSGLDLNQTDGGSGENKDENEMNTDYGNKDANEKQDTNESNPGLDTTDAGSGENKRDDNLISEDGNKDANKSQDANGNNSGLDENKLTGEDVNSDANDIDENNSRSILKDEVASANGVDSKKNIYDNLASGNELNN